MTGNGTIQRMRLLFRGIVQGVGFRPTVYRCAVACGLTGFVQNRRSEVVAEIQGPREGIERFEALLAEELPAPARIDEHSSEEIDPLREETFRIMSSETSRYIFPPIPPDLALCEKCRRELLDPSNRRYLYPFITCTECGPRFSIVEDTPFDRERTAMVDFPQCEECRNEYANPGDRRFHSQTNSCASCGPRLRLLSPSGEAVAGDPILCAIDALAAGRVVAIQGIGGFHLAADPRHGQAVARLRAEKSRGRKPFALMVRDLAEAERLCLVSDEARSLLLSSASPIVILPEARGAPAYLAAVSDLDTLGIMLPYTPLHALLFLHPEAEIPYSHLIMTSGNRGEEPIITDPEVALRELAGSAELFLCHDRRILFATDDSVVRVSRGHASDAPGRSGAVLLRRSRGYVPEVVPLAERVPTATLAAGGDLKNAPALAREKLVLLAPHLGDLERPAGREAYEGMVERLLSLYEAAPDRLVADLHPGYFSSAWAARNAAGTTARVQHHHAHILSVMAEHGLEESIGVAFDGTGYGSDGTIWGGEFLHARRGGFLRLGSFRPFPLPGGEEAIRHPGRIAYALLFGSPYVPDLRSDPASPTHTGEPRALPRGDGFGSSAVAGLSEAELSLLAQMLERGINSPLTSSAGRLFDAAAALLALVREVSYEGEGPMKLEALAQGARADAPASLRAGAEELMPLLPPPRGGASPASVGLPMSFLVDPRPLLARIAFPRSGEDPAGLALLFHEGIASAVVRGALRMREETKINRLALSGGVFQNLLLRELLLPRLEEQGFELYLNRSVPAGDGGLALGQVWYSGG